MISIARDLTPEREAAFLEIDQCAGRARGRYITDAPGQTEIYRAKELEAIAFQDDGTIGPFMTAEIAARGETAENIAAEWMGLSAAWRQVAVQIEQVRVGGKTAVRNASNPAQIKNAVNTAKAGLDAI